MSTRENRSIAYIYNEMDPSEKLEFERDLENDSNLLIEVESLKNITNSLNRLEKMEPPAHVVEAVCESAKKRQGSPRPLKTFFSVAAVLLIGMTSGIFLLDDSQPEENTETESTSASAILSGTSIFTQPVSTSSAKNLTPWIDNNDILHFRGQTGSENHTAIDSIKNKSFKKLTPVTDPSQIRPFQRQLQLTGGHN